MLNHKKPNFTKMLIQKILNTELPSSKNIKFKEKFKLLKQILPSALK